MSTPIEESRSASSQAGIAKQIVGQIFASGSSVVMAAVILVGFALVLSGIYYLLFTLISQGKWV